MEAYKTTCTDCGSTYGWIDYKTAEQPTQDKKDETVCKFCNSKNLKTEVDDEGLVEVIDNTFTIKGSENLTHV